MAVVPPPTVSILTATTYKPTLNTTPVSVPTPDYALTMLKSCPNIREFLPIHAHLVITNLIHDPEITNHVLRFVVSNNDFDCAYQVCNYTYEPETIIWNTLMENKLRESCLEEVFLTYYHMVARGVLLDLSTFHFLLHACSAAYDFKLGSEVHGRILKSGFGKNKSLNNNLMGMYSKCLKLEHVCTLFKRLSHRDVISWNTMISCYVSMRMHSEALNLYDEMVVDGVSPDEITMVSLLSACAKLRDLEMGKRLHLYIQDNNLEIGGSLLNCLVDMYVKCGKMEEAHRVLSRRQKSEVDAVLWTTLVNGYVKWNNITEARNLFDQMTERSLISWTTMMSGCVHGGHCFESLELFRQMRFENVSPDEVALVTVLSACARVKDFELGRAIHGLIVRYGMIAGEILGNALLDLCAKCEKLDEACVIFEQLPCKNMVSWNSMLSAFCRSGDIDKTRDFFDNMTEKDIVSWNTMINFYAKHDLFRESFELFHEMQSSNVKPDKITLICLLSSCARVGALNQGIWIHVYIEKKEICMDTLLRTALIDMYGKCGCLQIANELFSEVTEKNTFAWTPMIAAYAMEGHGQRAVDLFMEMEELGVKPDYVTFIALLSACSHGGLVDEGYKYFNKMRTLYGISPGIQHYGCMVDLLGRIGRLEEALKFIEVMPTEPDASIWSSLMRACRSHNDCQLAEFAFKHLMRIDPTNDAAYVLLANIYANAGRWEDASRVRKQLHDIGVKKQPGLSVIEHNGIVYRFTAGDFSNPQSATICSTLEGIERKLLKKETTDTSSRHSERLAVAFGLINSHRDSPIRVVNNVRICQECHSFMKLISLAYDREIVVRENYRIHRFKEGCCSCKDYW